MEKSKFPDWHMDNTHKCNINKLKRLVANCEENIIIVKNSQYKDLLSGLEKGNIDKANFNIFLSKLDYYLNQIRICKGDLGCHVVCFNEGYDNIKSLRKEFYEVYEHICKNGFIKSSYIFFHRKYKYIFQGITVDFRNIESMKQAKYVNNFIEILNYTEAINKIWEEYKYELLLPKEIFTAENILERLQINCVVLHKIYYLSNTYNIFIRKLLKNNVCLTKLNSLEEVTYKKISEFLEYIEYYVR